MNPLGQIDDWGVTNAAAVAFTADEILSTHGDTEQPFPLASVSKVLAAVTFHVAIEEGSISLDDPMGPPDVTVRHLLAHAGGLPPDGDRTPLGPPGRKRIYSNVGFEILGEHLATATGMPYADYATAALAQPLGLTSTTLTGSPAHAHTASAGDVVTVVQAVVVHRILAPETVEAMTTPAFPELAGVLPGYGSQDPNPWGLGVEVRGNKTPHWTSADNSPATWGHFGRTGTFVWFDPMAGPSGLGLVVLTDRDFDAWAIDAWPPLATAVLREYATERQP